jgi:hypothetical protein
MFLWLVILLLDVAVRRIVLNFRAIARKIATLFRFLQAESKESQTLERLRRKHQNLRDQLLARSADIDVSKRYEADEKYEAEPPNIRASEIKSTSETKPEKPAPQEAETKQAADEKEPSHIEQLLKAKRKAMRRDENNKKENTESET